MRARNALATLRQDVRYLTLYAVAPKYFETLGTRFLAGRDFNFQDQGRRVAIVNRSMARYYFPGGNPIEKHFTLDGGDRPYEIVGMAGDATYYEMREASRMPLDPEIAAYPETQKYQPPRSALDIAATRERLRQAAVLAGPPPALHRVESLVLGGYLRARQYWPTAGPSLLLVAYFHGGRFISGDLDSQDAICRMLALAVNCRVIAVDYRLAPEHRFPAAAEDDAPAVQWAPGQGTPVAGATDSAGANLAAVLGKARFWDSIAGIPLNQRQRFMINRMLDGFRGKLSTVKWAKLTKCSHDTALRDIKDLVARGVLVRHPAGGRSTSYSLAPDAH